MSAFAAADWGTTRLRLWLMDLDGTVTAERRSDEGLIAARQGNRFGEILESHLDALGVPKDLPVFACGMVGSRQGWTEAPYVFAPAALDAVLAGAVPVPDAERPVRIVPGMAQAGATPDVMRGEETQLAGLREEIILGRGKSLVCLPGTHSKWVQVESGRVLGFKTYLTGELFALLSERSILAHSVGSPVPPIDPAAPAFREACAAAADGDWAGRLFSVRAAGLLQDLAPAEAAATLSGLLVGGEIAAAKARFGGAEVVLVASGAMAALYHAALEAAGLAVRATDADEAVRAGLLEAARQNLFPGGGR